jgi:hypothetical protein
MKQMKQRMMYIIVTVVVIAILIIGYFLFFRKKEKKEEPPKKKQSNLNRALKVTGVIEEFQTKEESAKKLEDLKLCEAVLQIVFGKNNEGGLDMIYEDVMGKKFPEARFKCSGKTSQQMQNDLDRIGRLVFGDMMLAILKNGDIKKRNNDIVSIWVIMMYGIAKALSDDTGTKLEVERDGEMIKSVSFKIFGPTFSPNTPPPFFAITPASMIENADGADTSQNEDTPEDIKIREELKKIARTLINEKEIGELKKDTNPKMSIDKLASVLIYSISKKGVFSM